MHEPTRRLVILGPNGLVFTQNDTWARWSRCGVPLMHNDSPEARRDMIRLASHAAGRACDDNGFEGEAAEIRVALVELSVVSLDP
jgi:hypothetical protein